MGDPTSQALIAAAQAYDSLFVPALFNQWAPKVAAEGRAVFQLSVHLVTVKA